LILIISLALFFITHAEDAEDRAHAWVVLFDGTSTEHWRGFRQDAFPTNGWRIEQGGTSANRTRRGGRHHNT
jgi:hypothetical protein